MPVPTNAENTFRQYGIPVPPEYDIWPVKLSLGDNQTSLSWPIAPTEYTHTTAPVTLLRTEAVEAVIAGVAEA